MRALEFMTGHVIYNLAYTYKLNLFVGKTLQVACTSICSKSGVMLMLMLPACMPVTIVY